MAPKQFTREEAEVLLPRLGDLLTQLQTLTRQQHAFQEAVAELAMKVRSNGHGVEEDLRRAQAGLERTSGEISAVIERVQEMGCEVKGIDEGLVDFRTLMEGREVYLCWKLGEERISWWHELDTGFAGRQPLAE